jgi:hypothetical protein
MAALLLIGAVSIGLVAHVVTDVDQGFEVYNEFDPYNQDELDELIADSREGIEGLKGSLTDLASAG